MMRHADAEAAEKVDNNPALSSPSSDPDHEPVRSPSRATTVTSMPDSKLTPDTDYDGPTEVDPEIAVSLESTIKAAGRDETLYPSSEADARDPASDSSGASDTTNEPFDMVLGLSHHKTGTFQLRCLLKHFAYGAGLHEPTGECFKDNSVTALNLLTCFQKRMSDPTYKRPILFKTFHGLKQICKTPNGNGSSWNPCLSHMIYKPCTQDQLNWLHEPTTCRPDLPKEISFGFFNMIRNPIDVVLSAFAFHSGRPSSEPWLFRPQGVGYLGRDFFYSGADKKTLEKMGLARWEERQEERAAYVDLLMALPPEDGVIMEFWHSLPELVSVARQYQLLSPYPGAFHARFEDMRDAFNATILESLRHLKLGGDAEKTLESAVAGGCDPGTWTEEQRKRSNHVTIGKKEDFKDIAEEALMGYAPAKKILCELCVEMDYKDPRCENAGEGERRRDR